MKRNLIADGITLFFVLLFLYTGLMKLMDMHSVQLQLSESPLAGAFSGFISWALPIGELLLAIALLMPKWRLRGLYASLALMSVFTIYVTITLLTGSQLPCSCGGIIEDLSSKQHLIFNSACILLSMVGITAVRRQQATPQFKWVLASTSLGLFTLVGWLLVTAFKAPAIEKTGLEGKPFPAISLQLPDSVSYFNTANIPVGKPFIVVGFDPHCSHCQDLMADIKDHIKEFNGAHIYYITTYPYHKMGVFYRYFKLSQFPSITVGRDTSYVLVREFKAHKIPYVAIFDLNKKLRSVIPGRVTAPQLAQLVQQ